LTFFVGGGIITETIYENPFAKRAKRKKEFNMKISAVTCCLAGRRDEMYAMKVLADAGYKYYDPNFDIGLRKGPDFRDYYKRLREYADSIGLEAPVSHGPIAILPEPDKLEVCKEKVVKSIEAASILGAPVIVLHPSNELKPYLEKREETLRLSEDLYKYYLEYARKFGVKIAVENLIEGGGPDGSCLPNTCGFVEDYHRFIDLDPEYMTGCLDFGHASCAGVDIAEMVRGIGKERLFLLHVHDNDLKRDCHQLPYCGSIDFKPILEALGEIGFDGVIDFEADKPNMRLPAELDVSMARFQLDIGKYFEEQIKKNYR